MKESLNKLSLREISRRWCKGILACNEALVSFQGTGLTYEEILYIQKESEKIMNKITDKKFAINVEPLVDEYRKKT